MLLGRATIPGKPPHPFDLLDKESRSSASRHGPPATNTRLLRRRDNDKWTLPGDTLNFGESLTDCAIREAREETGLQIRITGLIGTYTDPHILIAYSDGEVRQEFTFVYAAEIESGELKLTMSPRRPLGCHSCLQLTCRWPNHNAVG
jgi:8-oxo-dGTP pyrophosphatase MutT (NUDIX family)